MTKRDICLFTAAFTATIASLGLLHFRDGPSWHDRLVPAAGSGATLWQVQTTFLSVGFAGLAIAGQLFSEAPLAIGASRNRVLVYIRAVRFVAIGIAANAVLAIETIWLPSNLGILGVTIFWCVPTVALLAISYTRLMRLFGNPSLLDEVVRSSFVETLADRLDKASRDYTTAIRRRESRDRPSFFPEGGARSGVTLQIPVPRDALVVRAVKWQVVDRAVAALGPGLAQAKVEGAGEFYIAPTVTLDLEPGDRTRVGQTAFRVRLSTELSQKQQERLVQALQSSIEFAPTGSVTPDEETGREIDILKDAIGTSLRSGAFGTAERALELLGQVIRGVWTARPESLETTRRSSRIRRDWIHRSIGEVEQDALLSPRACHLFIDQAMTRVIEAPRTHSIDYAEECMRSFSRIWLEVLRDGSREFDTATTRIVTCVQNLAEYSFTAEEDREPLQARAAWLMTDLVKLAVDARKPEAAALAAEELDGLYQFATGSGDSGRVHVRAGQLVLLGWLDYLADKQDERNPGSSANLRALVTPRGSWSDLLASRKLLERRATPFSHWEWWEIQSSASSPRAQVLELSTYIDRAQLRSLASVLSTLPPASDQETASEYERFIRLLEEGSVHELDSNELNLKQELTKEVQNWNAVEDERLTQEPLSKARLQTLHTSLRETIVSGTRLSDLIPLVSEVSNLADANRPILGLNLRTPRQYLVDKVFKETYANPADLGDVIARGMLDGEEHRIVDELRRLSPDPTDLSGEAVEQAIRSLDDEAEHYVLLTSFGGTVGDWYSAGFREVRDRVVHLETSALVEEMILFNRRTSLLGWRRPEDKSGLVNVEGTSIAIGVFDDVQGHDEPQVRIETGEYFVVWPSGEPHVRRFAPATLPAT